MVIGIVGTSAYQTEKIVALKPGERAEIAGYDLLFKGITPTKGPNYSEQIAEFEVTRNGSPVTTLLPSKRLYNAPPQPTTEAGIYPAWTGDLYVALGDEQPSGGVALRLYFHPLVRFIWIGAVIMFIGGIDLTDRSPARVGAPQRARSRPCRRSSGVASMVSPVARDPFSFHCCDFSRGCLCAGRCSRFSRTRFSPMQAWKSERVRYRRDCAASSVRTSRSTTATRRWPRICACWFANG